MSSANLYRFQDITPVLRAKELVDVVLSSTQRKTPTEVHKQFKISRIRGFYMRKVKFCQQSFHDRLTQILDQFPKVDDIHPFYGDLLNVLYDRDHYKLALGHVNAIRGLIDSIAKDYVRMMKYADSLYKCKMLKRAALGRMCTAAKKLQQGFEYLEEVRQHLGRLPSINPYTRSLILAGYPNVGKSSFLNQISLANVEVQPYAFTTKSLFVGHFDYYYSRWQVIDTPGILDRPLESRNTIEMTAITALAHLQATVLYLFDLSESCGYSVEEQIKLFNSIKPLFKNKPVVVVLNKADVSPLNSLPQESREALDTILNFEGRRLEAVECSSLTGVGIDAARNVGCDKLLEMRVEAKCEGSRGERLLDQLYVAEPMNVSGRRPPSVPTNHDKQHKMEIETEKHLQEQFGGPGVHSMNVRKNYDLANPEWKFDCIPEIFNGKNIADFVDADIESKLIALEEEEMKVLQSLPDFEAEDLEWRETKEKSRLLHKKVALQRVKNRLKRSRNKQVPSRAKMLKSIDDADHTLSNLGYDTSAMVKRITESQRVNPRVKRTAVTLKLMKEKQKELSDAIETSKDLISRKDEKYVRSGKGIKVGLFGQGRKGWRQSVFEDKYRKNSKLVKSTNSKEFIKCNVLNPSGGSAFSSLKASDQIKAEKLKRFADRKFQGKAGEADRVIPTKMPKHLFSGKRGRGKTDRR